LQKNCAIRNEVNANQYETATTNAEMSKGTLRELGIGDIPNVKLKKTDKLKRTVFMKFTFYKIRIQEMLQ